MAAPERREHLIEAYNDYLTWWDSIDTYGECSISFVMWGEIMLKNVQYFDKWDNGGFERGDILQVLKVHYYGVLDANKFPWVFNDEKDELR